MQMTIREVAKALQVQDNIIYRWISDQQLPAELVNGQYYFNRSQVLEWATVRKLPFSPNFFQSGQDNGIAHALEIGGIHYEVPGTDKEAVLRAVVERMPFPQELDRDYLLQVFLSREALGSTGVGDGLAIPHPRYPMVLPVPHPFITLCFLQKPIPYSGPNAQPVHTLFALVSPTVPAHLGTLAELASALVNPEFRQAILNRNPAEQILEVAARSLPKKKGVAKAATGAAEKPQ
jgi:PTS system nitrogen regulatory IIA component